MKWWPEKFNDLAEMWESSATLWEPLDYWRAVRIRRHAQALRAFGAIYAPWYRPFLHPFVFRSELDEGSKRVHESAQAIDADLMRA
jgi:hypothetical protein